MINTATKSLLVLAASGLMFVGAAAAQPQAGPGQVDPGHPRVNQVNGRETNQQKRIASGVKNGKLTPGQTAHLEKRERSIQNQQRRDMAKNNGHLTKAEQNHLNQRQNRVSKTIYKDKHSK